MSTIEPQKKNHLGTAGKKSFKYIVNCFDEVRGNAEYWNKWLHDHAWVAIINEVLQLDDSMQFTPGELNAAIARDARVKSSDIVSIRSPNELGLYKATIQIKGCGRFTAYYVTATMTIPRQKPSGNVKWWSKKTVSEPPKQLVTRQIANTKRSLPDGLVPATKPAPTQTMKKKMRCTRSGPGEPPDQIRGSVSGRFQTDTTKQTTKVAFMSSNSQQQEEPVSVQKLRNGMSYWTSGEAENLFGLVNKSEEQEEEDLSLRDIMMERIGRMNAAFADANGWRSVIDDFDQNDEYSMHDIFDVQTRCR
jgi:hypothetical protein